MEETAQNRPERFTTDENKPGAIGAHESAREQSRTVESTRDVIPTGTGSVAGGDGRARSSGSSGDLVLKRVGLPPYIGKAFSGAGMSIVSEVTCFTEAELVSRFGFDRKATARIRECFLGVGATLAQSPPPPPGKKRGRPRKTESHIEARVTGPEPVTATSMPSEAANRPFYDAPVGQKPSSVREPAASAVSPCGSRPDAFSPEIRATTSAGKQTLLDGPTTMPSKTETVGPPPIIERLEVVFDRELPVTDNERARRYARRKDGGAVTKSRTRKVRLDIATDRERYERLQQSPTMDVDDAAWLLGIGVDLVRNLCKSGQIAALVLPARIRVYTRPLFEKLGVQSAPAATRPVTP